MLSKNGVPAAVVWIVTPLVMFRLRSWTGGEFHKRDPAAAEVIKYLISDYNMIQAICSYWWL